MRLKEIVPLAKKRHLLIKRIDGQKIKYGGYKTGYLVINELTGKVHRWSNLDDFYLNCIELGRDVDGFARR